MKLIIDDANLDVIKKIYEYYPVDGVTTNPSILSKNKQDPYTTLKAIREFIGKDELHVQVVSKDAKDMIEEAHQIVEMLGENTYVKIPSVKEGFKAMKVLASEGILITATAIYTPMQAFLAAKSGAKYVAPYVNRIDNMGYGGVEITKKIHDLLQKNHLETGVLAASFKNSMQVLDLCAYGVAASTNSGDVIDSLVKNKAIDGAIDDFVHDFEALVGTNKTMLYDL